MFEKFTPEGVMVTVLAMEEAFELEHNYCGTEHLLVGLIALPRGYASAALSKRGLTLENVRKEIDTVTKNQTAHSINRKPFSPKHMHDGSYKSKDIRFTPKSKRVIELAAEAANDTEPIDTKHLLLGIMKEGSGVASRVLVNLGVDFEELKNEIESSLD